MRALSCLLILTACAAPAANEEEPLIVAKPVERSGILPAPASPVPVDPADKVVVMPPSSSVEFDEVDSLGRLLANRLHERSDYEVVTPDDIGAVLGLERLKDTLGCNDATCASDLAGALDARFVVNCVVDELADRLTFNLTLVDARAVRVQERAQVTVDRDPTLYDQAIDAAVARLLGDQTTPTSIATPSWRVSKAPPVRLHESALGSIFVDIPGRATFGDRWSSTREVESRDAEAALLKRWTDVGFEALDRIVVGEKPSFEKLKEHGALYWVVGEAAGADTGSIMGTQMHSLNASVSARVIEMATGKVVTMSKQSGSIGHISPEVGMSQAMERAATKCADELLQGLLAHLEKS